jgi:glycosyltransferase involved in cell wall biosynthesis
MKILIINDYGIEIGGVETILKNYKDYLIGQGHEVKVLTSRPPKGATSFSDYTYEPLNVKSIFRVFPYMFNYGAYRKVKEIIREYKPDIVHLHFTFYHTSPSVLLALKNVPTVMTLHAQEIIAPVGVNFSERCEHPFIGYCMKCTGKLKYYPEKIKRFYFKKLSKRINYFIAPSKYYADLHTAAGFGPVTYIYNGLIEKKEYRKIDYKNHNLLFVGRLAIEKGAEFPIRALPLIHKKIPNCTLTIVGNGPDSGRLKKIIKELHVEDYVQMVGKIPNEQTKKYYEQASIVVVPSTYPDNLPTVCIEAMHAGRPVIASNNGGIPELIVDGITGYLVEPGNEKSIAEKAIALFSDKSLLEIMSHNAKKRSENFTIKLNTQKILDLYSALVKNNSIRRINL